VDIGAQIGQYTLFAAKMGSDVVAIEPFYDNVIRIHKAALMERLTDRITLIQNALYDKRNEIKAIDQNRQNVGGQFLLEKVNQRFSKKDMENDKYLVQTILLDDVIHHIPKQKATNRLYEKALVKIDIEGIELFVLKCGEMFFSMLDVQVIFMEWGLLKTQYNAAEITDEIIDFFLSREFIPYSVDNERLQSDLWASWPFDIMWIKKNLI
jgi:FkbM family methyltransferase